MSDQNVFTCTSICAIASIVRVITVCSVGLQSARKSWTSPAKLNSVCTQ
jgi:hypothetical protein